MKQQKRWRFVETDRQAVKSLSKTLGVSEILGKLLYNRGYRNTESALAFLHSEENMFFDPFLMKGMECAVKRVQRAIALEEKITVYGDYDVDGISSTVLLYRVLQQLGAIVDYYIPERESEGYGLHHDALKKIINQGARLLITVDCGISAAEEIAAINGRMDVIVTDHHQPPEALPMALAILNPKQQDCAYPEKDLAGVGVAYKFCQALWLTMKKEEFCGLLDIAALGTIADVVPLKGENRLIVRRGLWQLNQAQRPGLQALMEAAGLAGKTVEAGTVGFFIAPRLNAAGRLTSALKAVELLLEEDEIKAKTLAEFLETENTARKQIQNEIFLQANGMIEKLCLEEEKVLVISGEGWNAGVIGLVAARLVELYYKPAIVISCQDGYGKASCRSIDGFNMHEALKRCETLLLGYGGHAAAAGFRIQQENIASLHQALTDYAKEVLTEEDYIPVLTVDGVLEAREISTSLVENLKRLEPYGMGNKRPIFACFDLKVENIFCMGTEKQHLKLKVRTETCMLDCVFWHQGALAECIRIGDQLDAVFQAGINEWNGRQFLQLKLEDLRTHETVASKLDALYATQKIKNRYEGIGEAERFFTKLVGVTFEGRQKAVSQLKTGQSLQLTRQKDNSFDANAIFVTTEDGVGIGYIRAEIAQYLAPQLDAGTLYQAMVSEVTGGGEFSYGVNLFIRKEFMNQQTLVKPAVLSVETIRKALIGTAAYHTKQQEVLDKLALKKNTMAIMGTGRGKSAIFQSQAALFAVNEQTMTIIVYPLRALVNDQFLALTKKLGQFGICIYKGCGTLTQEERVDLFEALQNGGVDILLSTPEFLAAHIELFTKIKDRIAFCVFDECHHFVDDNRAVYKKMDQVLECLGRPLTLSVTATAPKETVHLIQAKLCIKEIVIDPTVRENLTIVDQRNLKTKFSYLTQLVSPLQKTLIFVNSRTKAVELASRLREDAPCMEQQIGFYHAGLTNEWRVQVEDWFRDGDLKVVVATSAFGEGIDLPDIAHVVLYHLPFDLIAFNQQCGRCGRNGQTAKIHLLYGAQDVDLNRMILQERAPEREHLGKLYLILKRASGQDGAIRWTNAQIAEKFKEAYRGFISDYGIGIGLKILEELRLIERETFGNQRTIYFNPPPPGKLALETSPTHCEGLAAHACFIKFAEFAMRANAQDLLGCVNKPIYPID